MSWGRKFLWLLIAGAFFGILSGPVGRVIETFRFGMTNSLVTEALAQVGCVPNPNANGPPFVNGCPIPASGLNVLANVAGFGLPQVGTNAALSTLSPSTFATVVRLGFYVAGDSPPVPYTLQNSPCTAADNGAQVNAATGGKCWIANFSGLLPSPTIWGAKGDGSTDDTTALQSAITAMANGTLWFDPKHLYRITSTLTISNPLRIEGAFHYGAWRTVASGTDPGTCTWGIVARSGTNNFTAIAAQALTGSINGLCIDMSGDGTTNPASGAAISVTPPNTSSYSSGWRLENNTILQPNDGIAAYGTGVVNACCGLGTTADGVEFLRNTINNPTGDAISIGKLHTSSNNGGPGTVGITITDSTITCKTTASKTTGVGVHIYEGAIWYDGTQNGPEGCNIGFAVTPGNISGTGQGVQISADGVFGDQSGSNDLLIKPTAGGSVFTPSIGGRQPWTNNTTASYTSVLIDCTAAAYCSDINISNATFHGGNGQNVPIVDIEGGTNGPFNVTLANSDICQQGAPGGSGVALKLNAGSGTTGRWVITGNKIGTGCNNGTATPTGISLTINAGSGSHGAVTIVANDISVSATPISYTPSSIDHVIIRENMGIDDVGGGTIASAATITLTNAFDMYYISGSTVITTINGAWQGRKVRLVSTAANSLNLGTSGNICAGAITNGNTVDLEWTPGGTCWTHTP